MLCLGVDMDEKKLRNMVAEVTPNCIDVPYTCMFRARASYP